MRTKGMRDGKGATLQCLLSMKGIPRFDTSASESRDTNTTAWAVQLGCSRQITTFLVNSSNMGNKRFGNTIYSVFMN